MNHKQKVKLARKMQTGQERATIGEDGNPFWSAAWQRRKKAIAQRVHRRVRRNQIRRQDRERAAKAGLPVKYRMQ